ncbi:tRNA (adenosine(37)-N6)-dimethylallyltransferase MiaA [Allofustis seminis]|uniref:tRNA (adenosine(37)-N6)-dimethylallyltransferase MiaA n=1 Tax=Allofustis seminis TaxID=166939 RepID=UPI000379E197|nr:tRNA (adenosine(37)-N6)-dimethylallyltransferase MiaA [Allofustis seminis]
MKKVIVVVGPTAVGKTSLSIELAQTFNGEIISGDSMQVYKNLNIGTAKVTEEEMAGIPHYLLSFLPEDADYSVSQFQAIAREKIDFIHSQNKIPIIVGGTGLYIESLLYDVTHGGGAAPLPEYRAQLKSFALTNGNHALWEKLNAIDPQAAINIHENNVHRIIRALEVYEQTGMIYSAYQGQRQKKYLLYDAFIIGLNTDRQLLYQRINQRVDAMMDEGLVEEATCLFEKVAETSQAFKGIGYQEFIPYFHGAINLNDVRTNIKQNSRHYAKRQLTWFRNRLNDVHWYDLVQHPQDKKHLLLQLNKFLKEGVE